MAFYDFKCSACNKEFNVRTSPFELDQVQCPDCSGNDLQRLYKPAGMFVKTGKFGGSSGPRKGPGSEPPCANCPSGGSCGMQ